MKFIALLPMIGIVLLMPLARAEGPAGTSVMSFEGATKKDEGIQQGKQAFLEIIAGLMPVMRKSEGGKFAVNQCTRWEIPELMGFFIFGKPIERNFVFKEGCDLEGHLKTSEQPFPIDMKLRHLSRFTRVFMTWKLDKVVSLQDQAAEMKISTSDGVLTLDSGELMRFKGDYTLYWASGANQFRNRGGHFAVSEFRGKPVDFHEDLVVGPQQ